MKPERRGIVHVGDKAVHERTDPDYVDKRIIQLAKDYRECPKDWRQTFLAGLTRADFNALQELWNSKRKGN